MTPFDRRPDGARLRLACAAALLLGGCLPLVPAHAADAYPGRPVTLVVPFAPGSGADISARQLAKELGDALGGTVVVDNRPGANGAIGTQSVARAKADGYTLLYGSATTNAVNYAFFAGRLGYEPKSFDVLAGLGTSPVSLYVATGSPWKTLADLLADARRQPGKLSCGSGNAVTQVACAVFRRRAGIDAVNVPYKSNPQSLSDVAGGQVSYAFADASVAQALLEAHRLRVLAVAAPQRNPATPDVPTFREAGMADFELTAWGALYAPAGLPPALVERLHTLARRLNDAPEIRQSRERAGTQALNLPLPELRRFADAEIARWARYVKDSGVQPE